jgi:catechol 2,3-dioxygenase-like lactoylglutathione lyase family enzyme
MVQHHDGGAFGDQPLADAEIVQLRLAKSEILFLLCSRHSRADMLGYLMIGANDVAQSVRFYDTILLPLGYRKEDGDDYARYAMDGVADRDNGPGTVYVMKPFDGAPATPGNGMMPAFRARDAAKVRELHATGLAAGGTDEGEPGTRSYYSPDFYVGYLRDPTGNKLALFTVLEEQ